MLFINIALFSKATTKKVPLKKQLPFQDFQIIFSLVFSLDHTSQTQVLFSRNRLHHQPNYFRNYQILVSLFFFKLKALIKFKFLHNPL